MGPMLSEGKAVGAPREGGPAFFLITQAAFSGSGSLGCPTGNLSAVLIRCSD